MEKVNIIARDRVIAILGFDMKDLKYLNDFPWHDSSLLDVFIDRRQPGERDEVSLQIRWVNERKSIFKFSDCYKLYAEMNFGIISEESILRVSFNKDDLGIAEIQKKWISIGVDLSDLFCGRIETSSTNSKLLIYALSVEVENI